MLRGVAWRFDTRGEDDEARHLPSSRSGQRSRGKVSLKEVVETNSSLGGRVFDLGVQALILFSLVTFSLDTLPDLSLRSQSLLRWAEIVTVALFTVEYLLRVSVADRKLRFVFSFFGLVDVFAILPFYLSTGIDLRSIRALRLLRLFRVFKLLRYTRAIQHYRRAFLAVREELVIFSAATFLLLYVAAVGIYYFENEAQPEAFSSVFDSLWWAVATLTTVGYGDVYPVTLGGRVFTFLILMLGLGVVAVPSGLMASALSSTRSAPDRSGGSGMESDKEA